MSSLPAPAGAGDRPHEPGGVLTISRGGAAIRPRLRRPSPPHLDAALPSVDRHRNGSAAVAARIPDLVPAPVADRML